MKDRPGSRGSKCQIGAAFSLCSLCRRECTTVSNSPGLERRWLHTRCAVKCACTPPTRRSSVLFSMKSRESARYVFSTSPYLETLYLEYLNEPTGVKQTEKGQPSLSLVGYFRVIALSFIPFAKSRSADTISRTASTTLLHTSGTALQGINHAGILLYVTIEQGRRNLVGKSFGGSPPVRRFSFVELAELARRQLRFLFFFYEFFSRGF